MGLVKKMHMHWNPLVCPDGDARLSWSKLKLCMQKNSTCTLFSCAANKTTESASVALAKRNDNTYAKRREKAMVLYGLTASIMFLIVGLLLLMELTPVVMVSLLMAYIAGLVMLENVVRVASGRK